MFDSLFVLVSEIRFLSSQGSERKWVFLFPLLTLSIFFRNSLVRSTWFIPSGNPLLEVALAQRPNHLFRATAVWWPFKMIPQLLSLSYSPKILTPLIKAEFRFHSMCLKRKSFVVIVSIRAFSINPKGVIQRWVKGRRKKLISFIQEWTLDQDEMR